MEITSSVRGSDAEGSEFPTCCGLTPTKTTWAKGMGKDAVLLSCKNPECSNFSGVFACDVDIAKKWDRFRNSNSDETASSN